MASLDSTGIPPGIIMEAPERNIAVSSEERANAADPGTVILESSDGPLLPEEGDAQERLRSFWQRQLEDIQNLSNNEFKIQELPLARIKKIMKMDEDVKMISAEAPLLFSKAAQIFITELSLRAWVHTEESKRRTLQRNDIATAITKFDQFDFLIDIVPREELKPVKRTSSTGGTSSDLQQFFYTVPQQQQTNAVTATTNTNPSITGVQSAQQVSALQSGQLLIAQQTQNGQPMTLTPVNVDGTQLMQLAQVPQQGQSSQQVQGQPQAVVLNASSLNAGQMIVQDQRQQQQQQVNTQNAQTNEQKQQQQNIQAVLQQLMGNASNAQGEVHTIQMNSQGQLQLVKVVNPQQQQQQQVQNLAANSGIATRQDITEGNQVFTISENSAAQTSDGTSTIYVNPTD